MPTQASLERRLAYWQGVLRLKDWYVKVRWASSYELQDATRAHLGDLTYDEQKKNAVIRIGRPEHYTHEDENTEEADWATHDWEVGLVHELLHLHFAPFDEDERGSPKQIAQEQAIHAIAAGLVSVGQRLGPPGGG